MTIEIKNLNIIKDEIVVLSDYLNIHVDIVDYAHGITCSGTYLLLDNKKVTACSTTFSGSPTTSGIYTVISGGYSIDYAFKPTKGFTLTAVGSNPYDTISKHFDFDYGFRVNYNKVLFFDNNYTVNFGISAYNDTLYRKETFFATAFRTKSYNISMLAAKISSGNSAYKQLCCNIKPQSIYFMYGNTYTITISGVKDNEGNVMSPFSYTFTIESN